MAFSWRADGGQNLNAGLLLLRILYFYDFSVGEWGPDPLSLPPKCALYVHMILLSEMFVYKDCTIKWEFV